MKTIIPILFLSLIAISCTDSKNNLAELERLQMENDSLKKP